MRGPCWGPVNVIEPENSKLCLSKQAEATSTWKLPRVCWKHTWKFQSWWQSGMKKKARNGSHERQFLPIPPDLCLDCFISGVRSRNILIGKMSVCLQHWLLNYQQYLCRITLRQRQVRILSKYRQTNKLIETQVSINHYTHSNKLFFPSDYHVCMGKTLILLLKQTLLLGT